MGTTTAKARAWLSTSALRRGWRQDEGGYSKYDEGYFRYREYGPRQFRTTEWYIGEFMMFAVYWWFFHNFMYDPGHLLGNGRPNPVEWTDEELGIPQKRKKKQQGILRNNKV